MNIPDLRSLPETEAVHRALQVLEAPNTMRATMQELLAWCILRDAERDVLKERWEREVAAFAVAWADVPPVFECEGDTYRKADAYWTMDGGGMLGNPGRAHADAVRAAWEKVRPKGAAVSWLRDSSSE